MTHDFQAGNDAGHGRPRSSGARGAGQDGGLLPAVRLRLGRVRCLWMLGRGAAVLIDCAALAGAVVLVYAVADLVFAFSEAVRVVVGWVLAVGFGVGALWRVCCRAVRGWRETAAVVDRTVGNKRREVLTAYELGLAGAGSALGRYLTGRAQRRAAAVLDAAGPWVLFPRRALRRAGGRLAVVLGVAVVAFVGYRAPMLTAWARIIDPSADVPPYSRYRFEVSPASPRVVYGDAVELRVTIDGAPVNERVWLITRHAGRVDRLPCFREGEGVFVQRLDNVVLPLEFCFRTAKARSHWRAIELQLRPRIVAARATVRPPAYSGRAMRRFYLGAAPLRGLRRSDVQLEITSNRPLSGGELTLSPRSRPAEETVVDSTRTAPNRLTFEWTATETADLAVRVFDIQGTPALDDYRFEQTVVADRRPEITFLEPGLFSLATPGVAVRLAARVEDDLGLRRIDFVRSVVGYRDRLVTLPHPPGTASHEIERILDLARVGVEPGQELEFYIEAQDSNPSLTGVTASELVRLEIISHDEYAAMLRMRTTLEEFQARYVVLQQQMDRLRKALRTLADEGDGMTADERRDAIAATLDAYGEAMGVFEKVAADFAAFDMERQLPAVLQEVNRINDQYRLSLEELKPPYGSAAVIATRWLKELRDPFTRLAGQIEDANKVTDLGRAVRLALRLRAAVQQQESLVRSVNRFESPSRPVRNTAVLQRARERQECIMTDWLALREDIGSLAAALPESLRDVREGMLDFLRECDERGIVGHMEGARNAARNTRGHDTYHHATLALEALKALLRQEDNAFCEMARRPGAGETHAGAGSGDAERQTIAQICAALMSQFGSLSQGGGGEGSAGLAGGGMIGGDPRDGYWTDGQSLVNVPVIGPERLRFRSDRQSTRGGGYGGGAGGAGRPSRTLAEPLSLDATSATATRSVDPERVPARYREAVKRFFEMD